MNKTLNFFKRSMISFSDMLQTSILSDKNLKSKIVCGPFISYRLGTFIIINPLKTKVCSYNCAYCCAGLTNCCSLTSDYYLSPYELYISVNKKLEEISDTGKNLDYILISGSGEPTLDNSLFDKVVLLSQFGYKIALYTNGSLLWNERVKENLTSFDYISLKIDTFCEETWLKLNRPHKRLNFGLVLDGIKEFSSGYKGKLTTETMLVKGFNDNNHELSDLADYFQTIKPEQSFFSIPFYPSAAGCNLCPEEEKLNELSGIIKDSFKNPVLLCCPESEEFCFTSDFANELLGVLSLHPVNLKTLNHYVNGGEERRILKEYINNGTIKEVNHKGCTYLVLNSMEKII